MKADTSNGTRSHVAGSEGRSAVVLATALR